MSKSKLVVLEGPHGNRFYSTRGVSEDEQNNVFKYKYADTGESGQYTVLAEVETDYEAQVVLFGRDFADREEVKRQKRLNEREHGQR